MKKRSKRRISVRRRWVINPRTKVKTSAKIYKRAREKSRLASIKKAE